jgi:hypothetical protein
MRRLLALSLSLGLLAAAAAAPAAHAQTLAQNRRRPVRRPPRRQPPPPQPPPQVVDEESAIAHAVPLPAAPPTPVVAPPPPAEPAPEPDESGWRYPGLDVTVGARVFTRSLSWDGDATQAMRPYDLSAAPALRLGLEVYPGALTDSRAARLFGVVVQYETAIALSTVDARGRSYDTATSSLLAGLKVRAPFATERHEFALLVAYRAQDFTVRGEGDVPVNGAPDLSYGSLQVGITSRWALSRRFALSLDASYLAVLGTGQLGEVFPHASSFGLDVAAGVAVAIAAGFEVRAGADFRSYFHSFNPEDGDALALTGATDQQLAGWLAVALRR